MDSEIIYVLSTLGGLFICCLCSLISVHCLSICNNVEKEVSEPIRIEIVQPNYQTKEYLPQDAVTVTMAGTK